MWYNKYIGIPYKDKGRTEAGIDCWGLVRLVYSEQYGIDMPSFTEDYEVKDIDRLNQLFSQYTPGWAKLEEPKEGAVVLFRILGQAAHVGVMIDDKNFLHTTRNQDVCVVSLENFKWKKRVLGFYEYTAEAGEVLAETPISIPKKPVFMEVPHEGLTISHALEAIYANENIPAKIKPLIHLYIDGELYTQRSDKLITPGATLEYRLVPADDSTLRSIATLAIMYVAVTTGAGLAGAGGFFQSAAGLGLSASAAAGLGAVVTTVISAIGMSLVNQIFPVRLPPAPEQPGDPGSANPQLMLTGSRNEFRAYGAIPVVLGQYRFTAPIAATTYVEYVTDITYLRMLLCWGYGPLQIEDVKVGGVPLISYKDTKSDTLYGYPTDKLYKVTDIYGKDTAQLGVNVELDYTTNQTSTDDWKENVISSKVNRILVNLHFPEGLRSVNRETYNVGKPYEAYFRGEVQVKKLNDLLQEVGDWINPQGAYSGREFVVPSSWSGFGANIVTPAVSNVPSYRWSTVYVGPGGNLEILPWGPFTNINATTTQVSGKYIDPIKGYWVTLRENEYYVPEVPGRWENLVYGPVRPPDSALPAGSKRLLDVLQYSSTSTNTVIVKTEDVRSDLVNMSAPVVSIELDTITVDSGTFTAVITEVKLGGPGEEFYIRKDAFTKTVVFDLQTDAAYYKVRVRRTNSDESDLENSYAKPYRYHRCILDSITGITNGVPVKYPSDDAPLALTAIRIKATNQLNGSVEGINALCTSICKDYVNSSNSVASISSISGQTKFEITYTIANTDAFPNINIGDSISGHAGIPNGTTITNITTEYTTSGSPAVYSLAKITATLSASCTSNVTASATFTRNAWIDGPTRNPASLLRYVLQHPANAQRISEADVADKIDLDALQDWHTYCVTNNFKYDGVVTEQRSLLEVMRDICAAGRASPILKNGKWSVVIDRERTTVVQHFSPHNSWDFSSTKALVDQPHALRINFVNSEKNYQAEDLYVYNTYVNELTLTSTAGSQEVLVASGSTTGLVANTEAGKRSFIAYSDHIPQYREITQIQVNNPNNLYEYSIYSTKELDSYNVPVSTTQALYNTHSMYFDGDLYTKLGFLDGSAYNGSSFFEGWFYITDTTPGNVWLFIKGSNPTTGWFAVGTHTFNINLNNVYSSNTLSTPIPRNSWVHIKLASVPGDQVALYVNGTKLWFTSTMGVYNMYSTTSYATYIGAGIQQPGAFVGYVSEFRVTPGGFSPASTPSISTPTTKFGVMNPRYANYNNIVLLLRFDGLTEGVAPSNYEDTSKYRRAVTMSGLSTVKGSTSIKKFGTSAVSFVPNVSGSSHKFLSVSDNTNFSLGDTYTAEWWSYSTTANKVLPVGIGQYSNIGGTWTGLQFSVRVNFVYVSGVSSATEKILSFGTIPANQWVHVAIVREGSTARLYVDGTMVATRSDLGAAVAATTPCVIGKWDYLQVPEYTEGYIDDLIITKGVAKYSANFTPPTESTSDHDDKFEYVNALVRQTAVVAPTGTYLTLANSAGVTTGTSVATINTPYTPDNSSKIESMQLPGVTQPEIVQKQGKFHLAQALLRPETYTLSTDIENLVCNRGDLVRVTHDVPMWGVASGRIRNNLGDVSGTETQIVLEEAVYLESTKTYTIRIRNSNNGDSIVRSIVAAGPTDYYTTITVTPLLTGTQGEEGNLYLIGESNIESNELIVLGIEPSTNLSAKLTLTDYSPAVYSSDSEPLPTFSSNITTVSYGFKGVITSIPIYSEIFSDDRVVEYTSSGYIYKLAIYYTNPNPLETNITTVEARLCLNDDISENWREYQRVPLSSGKVVFSDLTKGLNYVVQIRYTSNAGNIGLWADEVTHVIQGKIRPPNTVLNFQSDMEGEKVKLTWDKSAEPDIAYHEIRLANSNWGTQTGEYHIVAGNSLLLPAGLLGSSTTYYIKAVDLAGNYSTTSATEVVTISSVDAPLAGEALPNQGALLLTWDAALPVSLPPPQVTLPLKGYEVRATDTNWGEQGFLYRGAGTSFTVPTEFVLPGLNNYYIKAIDTNDNYSTDTLTVSYTVSLPTNVSTINYDFADTSLTSASINISWNNVTPAFGLKHYKVSYDAIEKTISGNTLTLPADWIGTRTYTIKTIDNLGQESSGFTVDIVKYIPNPVSNLQPQVIDNTVLLTWNLPERTTLPIQHVLIKRGVDVNTAEIIGTKSGGFTSFQELDPGPKTYWVSVIDTDNHESVAVSVQVQVNEPPDYILQGEILSILDSVTTSNVYVEGGVLYLPINNTETWAEHFSTRSWNSIADQLAAGYPYYLEPSASSGYYEEVFDFSNLIATSQLTIEYSYTILTGSPVISFTFWQSTNGVDWTNETTSVGATVTDFRYIKVRVNVVSAVSGILVLKKLGVRLNNKVRDDTGLFTAVSTDVGGTVTNFNKEFTDVSSIIMTAVGTSAVNCVYDFKDILYSITDYSITSNVATITVTNHSLAVGQYFRLTPTAGTAPPGIYEVASVVDVNTFTADIVANNCVSGTGKMYHQGFKAYLFDSNGSRVSGNFSWSVKGY